MWDEVPVRTCPSCQTRTRTRFGTCASCGASLAPATPPPQRRSAGRRALAVAAGVGILAAAGTGTVLLLDRGTQERERLRMEQAAAVVAERARLARVQAPHRDAAPRLRDAGGSRARRLATRAALVRAVERAIAGDARARARTGELDGPVAGAQCGPLLHDPAAVPDDRVLDRAIGRYDCVALLRDVTAGGRRVGRLGHAFVAAVHFDRGSYVWCRNTPPQGERGSALAFVRLERECLAARGPALGTGYVDVDPGA